MRSPGHGPKDQASPGKCQHVEIRKRRESQRETEKGSMVRSGVTSQPNGGSGEEGGLTDGSMATLVQGGRGPLGGQPGGHW